MDKGPEVEYFILGDNVFPLGNWLIKDFSRKTLDMNEQVYNYWISRRIRVVENAFSILASRF